MKIIVATEEDFKEVQNLFYLLFKKEVVYQPTLDISLPYKNSKQGVGYIKKALKNPKYITLLAIMDKKIVGFLIGEFEGDIKFRINITRVTLNDLFVMQNYRNKGIGSALVRRFQEWAKSKEANDIGVFAFKGNERGIDFYKNSGFKDYGITLEKLI
ncbi:MAG TPA: GNAT family N-acetyltransferase [Patescibacteria group bacterium]|nr:GNAT family N-acetyltransferase [Patescibacteria group bacterium]